MLDRHCIDTPLGQVPPRRFVVVPHADGGDGIGSPQVKLHPGIKVLAPSTTGALRQPHRAIGSAIMPLAHKSAAVHEMIINPVERRSNLTRRTHVPGGNADDRRVGNAGRRTCEEQVCQQSGFPFGGHFAICFHFQSLRVSAHSCVKSYFCPAGAILSTP